MPVQNVILAPDQPIPADQQVALTAAIQREVGNALERFGGSGVIPAFHVAADYDPGETVATTARRVAAAVIADLQASQERAADERRRTAVADLGRVDSFGDGFYRAAGYVLESLVPKRGDKGKVQINVNIPTSQPGVFLGFEFISEAEKDRSSGGVDKIKLATEVGFNVTGKIDVKLWEVFARAQVSGFIEAYGDSGEEVFRLISYAIYRRVAAVSETVAGWVWDPAGVRRTENAMDREDYVQSGAAGTVAFGVSSPASQETQRQAGVAVRFSQGTRYRGGRAEDATRTIRITVGLTYDPFAGEMKLTWNYVNGAYTGLDFEFSGTGQADVIDLAKNEKLALAVCALLMAGDEQVKHRDGIEGGMLTSLAAIINYLRRLAKDFAAAFVASHTLQAVTADVKKFGKFDSSKMGVKLTLAGNYSPTEGVNGCSLALDRTTVIQWGRTVTDPLFVAVESNRRICKVPDIVDNAPMYYESSSGNR